MLQIFRQPLIKARSVRNVAILTLAIVPATLLAGYSRHPGGPNIGSNAVDGDHHAAEMEMKTMPAANPGADSPTAPNQVVIDNFTFSPATLTVAVGTEVTWVNRDDVPHTATSTSKPREIDSHTLDTDDRYTHVFKTAGTYDYFCSVHPHMTGQIIVK
jgi:plastocyanin